MPNGFFWYDLVTSDAAAAARFYAEIVGWGVRSAGVEGRDYTLFTLEGQGVAGLLPMPADVHGMPPCWTGFIHVDDIEATAARVVAEGGALLRPPTEIPGVIRLAVVGDDQGAGFIVATPLGGHAPPVLPPGTPGAVGWHELYAEDGRSALAFYRRLFGWSEDTALDMGDLGTYRMFGTGGPSIGGIMTKPPSLPAPFWQYYINVPAIAAAVGRIDRNGGTVLMGPHQVPGGHWIVHARDPQGATFALVAPIR